MLKNLKRILLAILIPILCFFFICAAIIAWILWPVKIDWSMTAYVIAADGTVESSFPITIEGKIEEAGGRKFFTIDYDVPREFRYWFSTPEGIGDPEVWIRGLAVTDPCDTLVYGSAYDCKENMSIGCYYVYNTELGYFLATWDNSDGSYLVAATDPDVETQDLIAHFDAYPKEDFTHRFITTLPAS